MKICKITSIVATAMAIVLLSFLASHASSTTVAVVQLNTADVGNFTKMGELASQAKAEGARLIIFPEGSVFGWVDSAVFTEAEPIPGKYSNQFAAIAKQNQIWVAVGLAEKGPKAGAGSLPNAYQAYDSAILINTNGDIVLHHQKYNVLKNSFDPAECKRILNENQCSYTPGSLSDIKTANTIFGKTALLVCADAYTYTPAEALTTLKSMKPDFVIIPWGMTASVKSNCGQQFFNTTTSTSEAASFLKTAFVTGANAVGKRTGGNPDYLPSVYCGTSGFADPTGYSVEASPADKELVMFELPESFDAKAGPVWGDTDAKTKCPATCSEYSATWNNQWTTTIWGQMSVCGCIPSGM